MEHEPMRFKAALNCFLGLITFTNNLMAFRPKYQFKPTGVQNVLLFIVRKFW
jgi:hypothetical protein